MILAPSQLNHRSSIKRLVQTAANQSAKDASIAISEPFPWIPLKLGNAIGVAVPISNEGAPLDRFELFLVAGIDSERIDARTTREIQARLVQQTIGHADNLICNIIPWHHRREPSHSTQFPSHDIVIRSELESYALMYPALPEARNVPAKQKKDDMDRFNAWNWKFLLGLLLFGAVLFCLENYLPPALRGISKAVSLIPVILWPLLYASRGYVPFAIRWLDCAGGMTAFFIAGYFLYNLLSTSVLIVGLGCGLFALIVAGITVTLVGKIMDTSTESNLSLILKYGGCILLNFIGLSIAWLAPDAFKTMYATSSAIFAGEAVPPPIIQELPRTAAASEETPALPGESGEIQTRAAFNPMQSSTLVARNVIKLKNSAETQGAAISFIALPDKRVVGATSRTCLESRYSEFYPACTPKRIASDLETWTVWLFRSHNTFAQVRGLLGAPEDYKDSLVTFVELMPGQKAPADPLPLNPEPPKIGEHLYIMTSFESNTNRNQRVEEAALLVYSRRGETMLLKFFKPMDIYHFEGSPVVDSNRSVVGIVLGPCPITHRPFATESDIIEVATAKHIWENLKKVDKRLTPAGSLAGPSEPAAPQAPKPVVMPDPFARMDLTKLEKELKQMKKTASRLKKDAASFGTRSAPTREWECEVLRFNRHRRQILAAFDRLKVQGGQSTLEEITLKDPVVDTSDPEKLQASRAELETLRQTLVEKRKAIDPSKLEIVEAYNDEIEWFNRRAGSFNKAAVANQPNLVLVEGQ